MLVERELRALANERTERRESVSDARAERRKALRVSANVDAFAAKVAAKIDPYPDPRSFVAPTADLSKVQIVGDVDGAVTIGDDLFTLGQVFADGVRVADTESTLAATFVRGVLLHEPTLEAVDVPASSELDAILSEWESASTDWVKRFEAAYEAEVTGIDDYKTRTAIWDRALTLLHAG